MAENQEIQRELEESYRKLGAMLGDSFGEGLAQNQDGVRQAADALSRELLESQKQYVAEKERLEREEEAAQEAKYRRDYENRLRKARTAAQAEIVRQNEQLRLQKKANKEYLTELEAHLDEVEAKIKAQKDRIVDAFNQIAKRAASSLDELERSREEMAEKVQDYGGIFDSRRVVFKNAGPGETPIRLQVADLDLSDEREQLTKYAELLQRVQELENIPTALFSEIRKLSIDDAVRYQEKLLKMSHAERENYLADWGAIQDISDEVSQVGYKEAVVSAIGEIERELSAWYETIPEGFFMEGEFAAEAFGSGFQSKFDTLKSELEAAVLEVFAPINFLEKESVAVGETKEKGANYSVTYVLNSAGETVSEQLRSAKQHADVMRLRGV